MYNMHYERRTIEKRNQIPIPRRCSLSPPPRNVVGGERYPVKSSIFGGKMKTKSVFLMDEVWYAEMAKAGYVAVAATKILQDMRDKVFPSSGDITPVKSRVYGM